MKMFVLNEFTHNYYSDWTTPDDNNDGFVDVPYSIEGASGNFDLYPIAEAGLTPTETVTYPPDVTVMLAVIIGLIVVVGVLFSRRK